MISLSPEKEATMAESRKLYKDQVPKEYLYFLDPVPLFTALLRSNITQKMFLGFGEFRTFPKEPWQSNSWLASIRSTSGQFAHYRNGEAIFPSDFINFEFQQRQAIGRVVAVGIDYRNEAPNAEKGKLRIKVQRALRWEEIADVYHAQSFFRPNELLLTAEYYFRAESDIEQLQQCVHLDYLYKDDRIKSDLPQQYQNYELFVRNTIDSNGSLLPLCRTAPIRAELELQTYGRSFFTTRFGISKGNNCISLPLMIFIDGFGLYRNAYRSIMGIYLLFASFSTHERIRRSNCFPITLGPHGSNFDEVVECLQCLAKFDKGQVLELPQPTLVCAFPVCFLGDMPQQQENSGCKTQRANLGCRFCLVPADSRGDLEYDTLTMGRYHNSMIQQRKEMKSLRTIKKQEEYATKWGLQREEPALFKISPALDIILTRPSDPAHSEYNGLTKQLHHLLITAILTQPATSCIVRN
jgi:hypothetical protein